MTVIKSFIRAIVIFLCFSPAMGQTVSDKSKLKAPPKSEVSNVRTASTSETMRLNPLLFQTAFAQYKPFDDATSSPQQAVLIPVADFFPRVWATGISGGLFKTSQENNNFQVQWDSMNILSKPIRYWADMSPPVKLYFAGMFTYRATLEQDLSNPERYRTITLAVLTCTEAISRIADQLNRTVYFEGSIETTLRTCGLHTLVLSK